MNADEREKERAEAIGKLQAYGFYAAEQAANISTDAMSMEKLLRSEGIVYADTRIGESWNSDDIAGTAGHIRKLGLFRKRGKGK